MIASALRRNAYSPYASRLSSHVGGSDFTVFMGLFTHWLLARRSVAREHAGTLPGTRRGIAMCNDPRAKGGRPGVVHIWLVRQQLSASASRA